MILAWASPFNNMQFLSKFRVELLKTRCPLDEHWAIQFKFSVTWSCVSLPRYITSSDWKCVWFEKFKSQHVLVFQYLRYILLYF